MSLENLKIGTRLALGFGVMLLLGSVLAMAGLRSLSSVVDSFRTVTDVTLPETTIANHNIQAAYDYARAFAYIVTSEGRESVDAAALEKAREALKETVKEVNENVARLEKLLTSAEERALLEKVKESRARYGKSRNAVLELKKAGHNLEAVELMFTETNSLQTIYIQAWKGFIEHEEALVERGVKEAAATYRSARQLMLIVFAAMLGAGVLITVMTRRSLVKSLGGEPALAAAVAGRIAAGELAAAIPVGASDRSSLMFAMNAMRDQLVGIVAEVRQGTEAICSASGEIAAGNLDLSRRTEEQAASLEETASSMEELTATVKQNADNARHANQLALTASDVAVKGGTAVSEVVDTMGSINASSRKIVDIISVIDGIAFQTNILALNAAVEAARAGEQGRGFAVVAAEVRNLAQRSAQAAKEIKGLIDNSVQQVEAGTRLVDQAGTTMQEVVASIGRVTDIMSEISLASQEQTSGIEQVRQAITMMDRATQQNAAQVEQVAAASGAMQEQADRLARVVDVFKLETHVPGMAAGRTAALARTPRAAAPRLPALAKAGSDWEAL